MPDDVARPLQTPKTLRVGKRQISVSDEEASLLVPLVGYLRELGGAPFELDRPAAFKPPPLGVVTPLRIRAMIRDWLAPLDAHRRDVLTLEILDVLTIQGRKFAELEKGRQ